MLLVIVTVPILVVLVLLPVVILLTVLDIVVLSVMEAVVAALVPPAGVDVRERAGPVPDQTVVDTHRLVIMGRARHVPLALLRHLLLLQWQGPNFLLQLLHRKVIPFPGSPLSQAHLPLLP